MNPPEQVAAALAYANEVRCKSAAQRREIAALPRAEGHRRVAELFRNPSQPAGVLPLHRALTAIDRIAAGKVRSYVRHAQVNPARIGVRVNALTEREREAMADYLERKADWIERA